jgi:hypothetical protein
VRFHQSRGKVWPQRGAFGHGQRICKAARGHILPVFFAYLFTTLLIVCFAAAAVAAAAAAVSGASDEISGCDAADAFLLLFFLRFDLTHLTPIPSMYPPPSVLLHWLNEHRASSVTRNSLR